jgi:hypothetical protein
MSIKFNDTQLVLLSAASQRDDHCLVPPTGPKRSHAQRAVAKLLEVGLVKEIRAKAGAPIWRRDEETGHAYTLKLTAVGVNAIAVDETPPSQEEVERRADHPLGAADPQPGAARVPMSPRSGTKIAEVISVLQRGDGATLAELVAATGWLPHTTRATLTGLRRTESSADVSIISGKVQSRGSAFGRCFKVPAF